MKPTHTLPPTLLGIALMPDADPPDRRLAYYMIDPFHIRIPAILQMPDGASRQLTLINVCTPTTESNP